MPRLYRTMATYGIMWTASDITQELVISRKDHVDWKKTARIATTGALVIAPLIHGWIHIVEVLFPGSSVKMILKKVLMEQMCFSPVAISTFYITTSGLEGKPGIPELEAKFKQTYLTGLTFWPFIQMLNFRFVPHRRKPQAIACASFVWSIFLCFMKEENGFKQGKEASSNAISKEASVKDC